MCSVTASHFAYKRNKKVGKGDLGPTYTIQSAGLQEAGACSVQNTYLQVAWISKLVETITRYLSSFSGSVLMPGRFWYTEKNEKQSKPLALGLPRDICCRNLLTFTGTNPSASTAVKNSIKAEDRLGDSSSKSLAVPSTSFFYALLPDCDAKR